MNKIEQNFYSKISGIPLGIIDVLNPDEGDWYVKLAKGCTQLTGSISVKFADWTDANFIKIVTGKWVRIDDLGYDSPSTMKQINMSGKEYTTSELYNSDEFINTL